MATTVSNDTPRGTNWTKVAVYCAAGAVLAFFLGKATHGLRHGHYEIVSPFWASRDQAIVVKPSAGASALASEVLTALRAPPPSSQWLLKERMAEDILKASQQLRRMGL